MQLYHQRLAHNVRLDPTKTTTLRKSFESELRRRFEQLKTDVSQFLDEEPAIATNKFEFTTSPKKVEAFKRWLRVKQEQGVLEVIPGTDMRSLNNWWAGTYVRSAYQKGLASAAYQMRRGGAQVADRWIDAGFFRPIHADALALIYTRAYSDLNGITQAIDTRLSNVLALGIADGRGVMAIAREMRDNIDSIGLSRSRVLARTEVIRSHAEATLNTYTEAGIEGVEVLSEFATAGDNKVCPKCKSLEGETYTIAEARGVIPVHPNCRCAWLPVVKSPEGIDLR